MRNLSDHRRDIPCVANVEAVLAFVPPSRPLVFVIFRNPVPRFAGILGAVWKNESNGLPGIEPHFHFVPARLAIAHGLLCEQGLERLGEFERTCTHVPRHDTEAERFAGVGAKNLRVVGMIPVHRVSENLHFVEAVGRRSILEAVDESVASDVLLRVHALVNIQVSVVVFLGRLRGLLCRLKVPLEMPLARGNRLLECEDLFDNGVRSLEVLIEQVAGGLKHIAEILHVFCGLIARELRRGIKSSHVQPKQIADAVDVFVAIQTAQNGASPGARECLTTFGERQDRLLDESFLLCRRRLLGLLRRHLAKMDLIQDVFEIDQRVQLGDWKRKPVKAPVALLLFRAVAIVAVGGEEVLNRRGFSGCMKRTGGKRK